MKTRIHYDSERYDETFRVGVEIEACLLDDNGIPVNANPLIKELEGTKHKVDYEYAWYIREERLAAVRSGYNAQTYFNILETIRSQLDFVRKGLSELGLKAQFLNILDSRLENKSTPGEYVVKLWDKKFNGSVEQTIVEVIHDIWQRTKNNEPIKW